MAVSVWVLTYKNRHGDDRWVFAKEHLAKARVKEVLLENLDDDDVTSSLRKKVKSMLEKGQVWEATSVWGDAMEEWFEVTECELEDDQTDEEAAHGN